MPKRAFTSPTAPSLSKTASWSWTPWTSTAWKRPSASARAASKPRSSPSPIGPARVQDALRTALAMGVDRAIHVETDVRLDAIALSKVLAQIATQEEASLILSGGQQADWDSHALGAATAERLNWPQATWTSALELKGTTLTGKHDADEGSETFTLELPAVITTQQGLNEPRYPTLPNIMKAKKKELRKESLDQFNVSPKLKFVSAEIQVKNRLNKILDGKDVPAAASQLVNLLRNEARVIA